MTEETPQETACREVTEALQKFINATSEDAALLDIALVTYEVVKFDDEGQSVRSIDYLVPTPNFSPSGAIGLAEVGRTLLRTQIMGAMFGNGEEEYDE